MSAHINNSGYELNRPLQKTSDHLLAVHWLSASIKRLLARRQQRLALARLDARLLADIGITHEQARVEFTKPGGKR